jgi:hypothetical protein
MHIKGDSSCEYPHIYCCSLQGEEAPLTDLYEVLAHREEGQLNTMKHIVVALLGRFKGETGEVYYLMTVVDIISHSLEPGIWIG